MNDKEVIAKLIKIAHTQQQIIAKLAQNQDPNQVTVDVGPQRAARAVNPDPPPTSLSAAKPASISAAIMSKLTDANKDQIPMPIGLEVDGDTLYWFTRNKMQPTAMNALHKDIVKATKTVQKEFGNLFPESKYITSCQYRPFRTAPMIVGQ